jgi:hypothetical protein
LPILGQLTLQESSAQLAETRSRPVQEGRRLPIAPNFRRGSQGAVTDIHSRYRRIVGDLPAQGRLVILRLVVRKFRCVRPDCPRRIFCERLSRQGNVAILQPCLARWPAAAAHRPNFFVGVPRRGHGCRGLGDGKVERRRPAFACSVRRPFSSGLCSPLERPS